MHTVASKMDITAISMGKGGGVSGDRGFVLNTFPYLVSRLGMSRAITLPPPLRALHGMLQGDLYLYTLINRFLKYFLVIFDINLLALFD